MKHIILALFMLLPALAHGGSGYTPPSGGGVSGTGSGITDASAFRTALGLGSLATESSPYAADSWDYSWTAAQGAMASSGWTNAGTGAASTDTSDTISGVACRTLTPPAGTSSSYVYHDVATPPDSTFEFRALIYLPVASSTSLHHISFSSAATGINRRVLFIVDTAGLKFVPASTSVAINMTGISSRWIWLTVRVVAGGNSGAGWFGVWLGGLLVNQGVTSDSTWRAIDSAGRIALGKGGTTSASSSAVSVAAIYFRNGLNAAPPEYTFRALNGAAGP